MTLQELTQMSKRNRDHFNESISLIAAALHVGDQTRELLCPSCGGGNTKERSFSIRKTGDGIHYRCWRATCDIKGIIDYTGSLVETPKRGGDAPEIKSRHYLGRLIPVDDTGLEFFYRRFGLTDEDIREADISYAPEENRYAFPVQSPTYARRGLSLRTFEPKSNYPKWDHYRAYTEGTWLGWYKRAYSVDGPVVVVEDPISALKISRSYVACYLNGTSLSYDKLSEINKYAGRAGCVIALDKDASAKAIELLQKYTFFLGGNTVCVQLDVDAKYMSDAAIKSLIGETIKDKNV